jgi:hypothetical protein
MPKNNRPEFVTDEHLEYLDGSKAIKAAWLLPLLFITSAFGQTNLPINGCTSIHNMQEVGGYYQAPVVQGPTGWIEDFAFIVRQKTYGVPPHISLLIHTDFGAISTIGVMPWQVRPLVQTEYVTNPPPNVPPLIIEPVTVTDNNCGYPQDFYLFRCPIRTNITGRCWVVIYQSKEVGAAWWIPPVAASVSMPVVWVACRYQNQFDQWSYFFKPMSSITGYPGFAYGFNYRPVISASYTNQALTLSWPEGLSNMWLTSKTARVPVAGSSATVPATNHSEFYWLEK